MMSADRHRLVVRVKNAIKSAGTEQEVLRTAVQLIHDFSDGYSWTGIYMMRGDYLEVGPYVGAPTPHTRIGLNQGICGAAASLKQTVIVDDVTADPRFLACSLTTRSEIVVPLMHNGRCLGEIDIDSDRPAFFTADDKDMLEVVVAVIVERLNQIGQVGGD